MSSFKVVLNGEPGSPSSEVNTKVWNAFRQKKCNALIDIERQFVQEKLKGPLEVEITFFLSTPNNIAKEMRLGRPHDTAPYLSAMIRFVTEVAHNKVYANEFSIYSIKAKKFYSLKPRTEITFTEKSEENEQRDNEIKELKQKRREEKTTKNTHFNGWYR